MPVHVIRIATETGCIEVWVAAFEDVYPLVAAYEWVDGKRYDLTPQNLDDRGITVGNK